LAAKSRVPIMYRERESVEAGGLITYGPNLSYLFRRAATYVDKILKGAKPADLPIEQPIKFELVINLKTARALGLTIPQSVLLRARGRSRRQRQPHTCATRRGGAAAGEGLADWSPGDVTAAGPDEPASLQRLPPGTPKSRLRQGPERHQLA
jgi:ABC transporter substrate binding protein